MAHTTPPFDGIPGKWIQGLGPNPLPPARGYRVVSGLVWWRLIHWPWRQYQAAAAMAIAASPPNLAPHGAPGVYFTDIDSLRGLISPADFALRLSLPPQAHAECQSYGCAVIEFDVPHRHTCTYPAQMTGANMRGLTAGGAREWLTPGNVAVNNSMVVTYIDVSTSGPRYVRFSL